MKDKKTFFESIIAITLKKDIAFQDIQQTISNFINKAMLYDKTLSNKHKENDFKYYVFNGFTPIQKDGIYKKSNMYKFKLRSADNEFIDKMQYLLKKTKSEYINVEIIEQKFIKQHFISKIQTITPVVISLKNKEGKIYHWTFEKSGDIMQLQKSLQNNLIKKYEGFFKEKIEPVQNFIQLIEIKNKKPQTINYKGIKLFGNKFLIAPNEDEISQKLAFFALGVGLGEKNSLGCGFCVEVKEK